MYGCYGTPSSGTKGAVAGEPIRVELPKVKTLFDECDWRPFISMQYPYSNTWDIEMRSLVILRKKKYRGHVCDVDIDRAMYIDVRTIKDDTPADETGEHITKITPQ